MEYSAVPWSVACGGAERPIAMAIGPAACCLGGYRGGYRRGGRRDGRPVPLVTTRRNREGPAMGGRRFYRSKCLCVCG